MLAPWTARDFQVLNLADRIPIGKDLHQI